MLLKICILMCISFVTSQVCIRKQKYISCDTWKTEIKNLSWYEDGSDVDKTFPGIVDIELSNCGLVTLGSEVFEDYLNEIRYISLSNNYISQLDDNLFKNNMELEILKLNNNSITNIRSATFKPLVHLKHLYLQDNKLTEITDLPFHTLVDLVVLHLERNRLTRLSPNTFSQTKNLRYLNLEGNRIMIPPRINDLINFNDFFQTNPQFFKVGESSNTPVIVPVAENDGMVKYVVGAVIGGIIAALLIFGLFFILRKRLMPQPRPLETPYYDEIKNVSTRTSVATSNSYIQPNFNPNLNQHLTARNFSYLEPTVVSNPSTSKPFRRSDSYEKDIELPSMPERPTVQPNAYNTFINSSFTHK